MPDFRIGDKVKINWPKDKSNNRVGVLVRQKETKSWLVEIVGFDGHPGDSNTTDNCWWVAPSYLILLKPTDTSKDIISYYDAVSGGNT